MANSNFSSIDSNKIATARQVFAVASHFASIKATSPSERYGLTKVFNAVLNKHYKDSDSFMTHAEVSEWFEWDCVPEQFSHMISTKKSKAVKKPAASRKPKLSENAAVSKAPVKAKAKPKASKASKKESTLAQRVEAMEATQAKILKLLEAIAK
jgi:hypothetical protein